MADRLTQTQFDEPTYPMTPVDCVLSEIQGRLMWDYGYTPKWFTSLMHEFKEAVKFREEKT